MIELYCLMCGHVWTDKTLDCCPECQCRDFMVNDDAGFDDRNVEDGHYEGDFPRRLGYDHGHGD